MTRSRRRVGTKTAVRDPGVVPVCGVDVDAADEPVRRRGGVVVEAGPGNRACRILIDVLGDKDPAPSGRRHAVEVSALVRSIAATALPARVPHAASVNGVGPRRAQSPQVAARVPNHSLQTACASAYVLVPRPAVLVRYAVRPVPANIVLLTTGSLITGE